MKQKKNYYVTLKNQKLIKIVLFFSRFFFFSGKCINKRYQNLMSALERDASRFATTCITHDFPTITTR